MAASSPIRPSNTTPGRRKENLALHRTLSATKADDISDSPSRQLVIEFHKLWSDQDRHLQQDLDEQVAQQAQRHNDALAWAAAEHERIRRNAEIISERVQLEEERKRKLFETREKERLEAERQAKIAQEAEARKAQQELLARQEREQTAKLEEEKKLQASRLRLEQQKEEAARQRQEAEELAKAKARESLANAAKAREEAAKKAAAAPPVQQPTTTTAQTAPAATKPQPSAAPATAPSVQSNDPLQIEFEQQHKVYLQLHKYLKEFRQHVIAESKKVPALKSKLGDWRREIMKSMGQLTSDKTKNKKPMVQIQTVLQEALQFSEPSVDVSKFLVSVPHPAPGQPIPLSAVFLYLINIFSKAIVSQFISETSGAAKNADPVGVVAVSILATPAFKLNGTIPLIDMLLAKYHFVCPLLFGIVPSTPQNTVQGRLRMGWSRDGQSFVPEQRHLERMVGLSRGWSALSLRDFSKSKNENPIANAYYWRAIAGVANVATADVGSAHAAVIKGLVDGFVPRFIGFYGVPAKAALRAALVELPARVRRERGGDAAAVQAVAGLEVLREVLQRDLKMNLTD